MMERLESGPPNPKASRIELLVRYVVEKRGWFSSQQVANELSMTRPIVHSVFMALHVVDILGRRRVSIHSVRGRKEIVYTTLQPGDESGTGAKIEFMSNIAPRKIRRRPKAKEAVGGETVDRFDIANAIEKSVVEEGVSGEA